MTYSKVSSSVAVDNAPNDHVYPQMADFTFYGGLYRDVNVISVPETHFDLDYYGTHGIAVTPIVEGANASVEVVVFVTDATEEDTLEITSSPFLMTYSKVSSSVASVTNTSTSTLAFAPSTIGVTAMPCVP